MSGDTADPATSGSTHPKALRRERLARIVSDAFSPPWVMIGTQAVVAMAITPSMSLGLRWAAISGFFTAVLPYAFVLIGVRLGRLGDRNLRARNQRLVPVLFGLVTCAIGLVILVNLGAPREIVAVTLAPLASMPPFLVVNHYWTKLSIHTGCMLGAASVLTMMFGLAVLTILVPLVFLTGWSRVRLNHHTVGQVLLGGMVGGVVTTMVYSSFA